MSEELEVLKQVTQRLEGAGISYMVTGSTAANFYSVPRMTRDIDIVVELLERDVERFISLFEKDYYLEPETVREAVKTRGMFNLIHEEYIIKIDFVVRQDTPYRRCEFSRRKKVSVDDQNFYLVAPGRFDSVKARVGERFQIGSATDRCPKPSPDRKSAQPSVSCSLGERAGRRNALS